jgi:hypothetical protein
MSSDIERWEPLNDATAFESLYLDLWTDIWQDSGSEREETLLRALGGFRWLGWGFASTQSVFPGAQLRLREHERTCGKMYELSGCRGGAEGMLIEEIRAAT